MLQFYQCWANWVNPKFRIEASKFSGQPGALCSSHRLQHHYLSTHSPPQPPCINFLQMSPHIPLTPTQLKKLDSFFWLATGGQTIGYSLGCTHRRTHTHTRACRLWIQWCLNRFVKILHVVALLSSKNSHKYHISVKYREQHFHVDLILEPDCDILSVPTVSDIWPLAIE